jgi:hypothetical protein
VVLHAAEFWSERVEMMQVWADYLGELRAGTGVISLSSPQVAHR